MIRKSKVDGGSVAPYKICLLDASFSLPVSFPYVNGNMAVLDTCAEVSADGCRSDGSGVRVLHWPGARWKPWQRRAGAKRTLHASHVFISAFTPHSMAISRCRRITNITAILQLTSSGESGSDRKIASSYAGSNVIQATCPRRPTQEVQLIE